MNLDEGKNRMNAEFPIMQQESTNQLICDARAFGGHICTVFCEVKEVVDFYSWKKFLEFCSDEMLQDR